MVCFRYIIVNTLHKGDIKDNNNSDYNDNKNNNWVLITIRIRISWETQPTGYNNSPTDCHKVEATC